MVRAAGANQGALPPWRKCTTRGCGTCRPFQGSSARPPENASWPHQHGVAYRPDPEPGLRRTQREVGVVVEDEDVGTGSPTVSTTRRRTRKSSKATTSISTGGDGRADRTASGNAAVWAARPVGCAGRRSSCSLDQVSVEILAHEHEAVGQVGLDGHQHRQESGAGTTSSSISQMRSKPPSYAVCMPIRNPPAPPTLSSLRITWNGRLSRASTWDVWPRWRCRRRSRPGEAGGRRPARRASGRAGRPGGVTTTTATLSALLSHRRTSDAP